MTNNKVVFSILTKTVSHSVLQELADYGYEPTIIKGRYNQKHPEGNFVIFTIRVPEDVDGDYSDWALDLDNLLEDWKHVPGTCYDLEMFEVFEGETDDGE